MKKQSSALPEAILVLGLQLKEDGSAREEMLLRARRAACLHKKTGLPVICCGGETRPGFGSEAEALRRILLTEGVKAECILLEDLSLITAENIRNAKRLLRGDPPSAMLVTSDYHMLRAKLLSRKNGLHAVGMPVKTPPGREKLLKRLLEILFLADLLLGFQGSGKARPKWLQAASEAIVKPLYRLLGQRFLPEYKNEKTENGGTNQ